MTVGQRLSVQTALMVFAATYFVVVAQGPKALILQRIKAQRLVLADLRNYWYTTEFPEQKERTKYSGQSEYLYSVVSPNGRSMFATRRQFDTRGYVFDTLIRRELKPSGPASEEIVPVPFAVLFQFAVSSNERFMVIAGRPKDSGTEGDERDGLFLLDRTDVSVRPVAPYEALSQGVRSLNVNDLGDRVIYEDNGTVMVFAGVDGLLRLADHHAGTLPVLMPDQRGYIYSFRGQLILKDGQKRHELLNASDVVGAIRVSPDGQFIAFGVDLFHNLNLTRLTICDLKERTCMEGPKYSDWIAGRETYWIKQ